MTNTVGFFLLGVMVLAVGGFILAERDPVRFARVEADFLALFSASDTPNPESGSSAPSGPSRQAEEPVASAEPSAAPSVPASSAPEAPVSAPVVPMPTWRPLATLPAKPNWTWTTTDGHVYKNVVVQKIDPANVSILDDGGGATVAITTLPADLQKQLNYDPVVAAASAAISSSNGFNYYTMSSVEQAKVLAEREGYPLAWVCGDAQGLTPDPTQSPTDSHGLTQMAMAALQGQAVVLIYIKTDAELARLPANVHEQFYQRDDGAVPGGHHFIAPKIVFTSGDGTTALGRVSYTQMKADGEGAITSALKSIGTQP